MGICASLDKPEKNKKPAWDVGLENGTKTTEYWVPKARGKPETLKQKVAREAREAEALVAVDVEGRPRILPKRRIQDSKTSPKSAAVYELNERVQCRSECLGDDWFFGVVTSTDPLEILVDGTKASYQYDEVRADPTKKAKSNSGQRQREPIDVRCSECSNVRVRGWYYVQDEFEEGDRAPPMRKVIWRSKCKHLEPPLPCRSKANTCGQVRHDRQGHPTPSNSVFECPICMDAIGSTEASMSPQKGICLPCESKAASELPAQESPRTPRSPRRPQNNLKVVG